MIQPPHVLYFPLSECATVQASMITVVVVTLLGCVLGTAGLLAAVSAHHRLNRAPGTASTQWAIELEEQHNHDLRMLAARANHLAATRRRDNLLPDTAGTDALRDLHPELFTGAKEPPGLGT